MKKRITLPKVNPSKVVKLYEGTSQRCEHRMFIKINHWWFKLKCKYCNRRYRWLPKGDYHIWISEKK